MGCIFSLKGNYEKTLLGYGRIASHLFAAMTNRACAFYGIDQAISWGFSLDDYDVDEAPFCAVVEAVFAQPCDLYCCWASHASGAYEIIKDQKYSWGWRADRLPLKLDFYTLYDEGTPQTDRGLKIGKFWPSDVFDEGGEVLFVSAENKITQNKVLARMNANQARLFTEITAIAAQAYLVEYSQIGVTEDRDLPSGLSPLVDGVCQVNGPQFCHLVELVFQHSRDMLYPWARHAAGIYCGVKNENFYFGWDPHSLPFAIETLDYIFDGVEPPTQWNRRTLGPHAPASEEMPNL